MVLTGLENLINKQRSLLDNRHVGLVTHPAATTHQLIDSVSALRNAGINLRALFGPEHGFNGAVADGAPVDHAIDPRSGLPVYSLYGKNKEPTAEMLAEIDTLVFDMQDVGVRFYTFISTMVNLLKIAARVGIPVLVLDRPNPINGKTIEGPGLDPGLESFIGALNIPIRTSMTMAELALFANDQLKLGAQLQVVTMKGWKRSLWFDQTGLPWLPTSPAMPHLSTAILYPGTCLCEGTTLSEGRGTSLPFEVAGAPWVDGYVLSDTLNNLNLAGVRFRPTFFTPSSSKFAGQVCGGVQLHVIERQSFQAVAAGLHLLAACRVLYPQDFKFLPSSWEGRPAHFDLLIGNSSTRQRLSSGEPVDSVLADWRAWQEEFLEKRKPYTLYP